MRASITRRELLGTAGVGLAAASLGGTWRRPALAAGYPERNIDVVIPTREGGGADRLFRAFTTVWKNHLNVDLEPGFFPGASGAVGYETFVKQREPDAYNLLFGNMGPELAVIVVQESDFGWPDDFRYFARLDVDPSVMFVAADSPFQSVDDVVAAAKERTLNVATSRLPHPASIGALLLGEHTGASFNLVPLSGGRNTIAGVVTGEVDIGVLPSGGIVASGDTLRTLLVWDDTNPYPDKLDDAPTMNEHFGTDAPPLVSSRAFAIHSSVLDAFPERFEILQTTAAQTAEDPAYLKAAEEAGQPLEILKFGDIEACDRFAEGMIAMAQKYKGLLTGEG